MKAKAKKNESHVNLMVFIEERNGEYEYLQRYLAKAYIKNNAKAITKFCENKAKTWYGDKPSFSDDNTHYFNGEVAARYSHHHVLTDEEFEVMNRLLY